MLNEINRAVLTFFSSKYLCTPLFIKYNIVEMLVETSDGVTNPSGRPNPTEFERLLELC